MAGGVGILVGSKQGGRVVVQCGYRGEIDNHEERYGRMTFSVVFVGFV